MDVQLQVSFIQWDQTVDRLPFLSTATNLLDIFIKCVLSLVGTEIIAKNRYYTYLNDKSFSKCVVLLFPFFGSILIFLHEFYAAHEAKKLFEIAEQYADDDLSDDKIAVKLFEKAALGGSPQALCSLGIAYEEGLLGLTVDPGKALFLYQQAACHEDINAIFYLAVAYEKGHWGLQASLKEALYLYQQAAKRVSPEAHFRLGVANQKCELGLKKDESQAELHYNVVMDNNHFWEHVETGLKK